MIEVKRHRDWQYSPHPKDAKFLVLKDGKTEGFNVWAPSESELKKALDEIDSGVVNEISDAEKIHNKLVDTEVLSRVSRLLEDVIDSLDKGQQLPAEAKEWVSDRAAKRKAARGA